MKKEFLLYAVVSVMAVAVDVAILYLAAVRFGMPAYLAAALAYSVGLVVHYLLSVRYVFAYRRMAAHRRTEAIVYSLTGFVGIALNAGIVYMGGLLGQSLVVSKSAAIVVSFVAVFIVRKITLFSGTRTGWKCAP